MTNELANTSGSGKTANIPQDVLGRFNWGAFLLSWIWGLGNNTYITLFILLSVILVFIPFGGLVPFGLCIWFGIKGNEWAWQNKHFESVEKFHEIQKKWAIAGTIVFVIGIIFSVIMSGAIIAALLGAAANSQ